MLALTFAFMIVLNHTVDTGNDALGQVVFVDVGSERGLLDNQVDTGFGGGVAAFDYDRDGDIDLFLPQKLGHSDRLYENDGTGRFSDIAAISGLEVDIAGRSALWIDYDDDHLVDLLITSDCFNSENPNCGNETSIRMYRQFPAGHFTNVTGEVGLNNAGIETFFGHRSGLSCGDVDHDGDLDLLLGQWEGELQLFINHSGVFIDETLQRGITNPNSPQPFNPWQSVMHDFNGDGWIDIYTAVDFFENQFWLNQGDGTFVDIAESSGTNFSFNDMGITVGDYDNDGDFDMFVTNIFELNKHNLLLRNDSTNDKVVFTEVAKSAGVNDTGFGWGATWFDANNDTLLDLAVTNGWFNGVGFEDTSRMYLNSSKTNVQFRDISAISGFNDPFFGSCLISSDLNRDGDLDLLQVCNPALFPGPFRIMENQLNETSDTNWLVVQPRQAGLNHWSIGTVVTIEIGDLRLHRSIGSGTSIHGQEPAEAFFGLGNATSVDRVIVRWPHGDQSVWEDVNSSTVFETHDADFNHDGSVSLLDIATFTSRLGPCSRLCQEDLNHDGTVDLLDASIFVDAILENR